MLYRIEHEYEMLWFKCNIEMIMKFVLNCKGCKGLIEYHVIYSIYMLSVNIFKWKFSKPLTNN